MIISVVAQAMLTPNARSCRSCHGNAYSCRRPCKGMNVFAKLVFHQIYNRFSFGLVHSHNAFTFVAMQFSCLNFGCISNVRCVPFIYFDEVRSAALSCYSLKCNGENKSFLFMHVLSLCSPLLFRRLQNGRALLVHLTAFTRAWPS